MIIKKRRIKYHSLQGIFLERIKQITLTFILCVTLIFQTVIAIADLPMTGVQVEELVIFDQFMQNYMGNNELEGGILAISKNGCVVYQRGFGYAFNGTDPLPENTVMRLASVEKPHTAAMIRYLEADGDINFSDFVFDVGQALDPGQRALLDATPSGPYYPYNGSYGDAHLGEITVGQLIWHKGGWDRGLAPDPFGTDITIVIGNAIGTYPLSPPDRTDIVKYMMSQPLQFVPGIIPTIECAKDSEKKCIAPGPDDPPCHCDNYCNFGYMLLSLIIEQESHGQHTQMIRERVLTPEMWVPSTEIIFGRAFREDQSPREPLYHDSHFDINVYDPSDVFPPKLNASVPRPYGSFVMENKTGEGNLVGSAAPLLTFMDHYNVESGAFISSAVDAAKNGGLRGTSTRIQQYSNGFNIVVLFNYGGGHADIVLPQVYAMIEWASGIDWESLKCIDGFWLDFNASSSGFGGYNDPFHTMTSTLTEITDGTKLRVKPGSSNWSGTISTRTLIDAPFGTAIIGQ